MTTGTVEVADVEIGYTDTGEGPPVVFVHGLAEDRTTWAAQQRELTGVRAVSIDVRGHGDTTLGRPAGTLAQLGADLVGVLESLTGPATCVGFSLGGTVVLRAAVDRPDLVAHAIVLGTSSVVGRAAAGFYADRVALVEGGDRAALRAAMSADTAAGLASEHADLDALVTRRLDAVGVGGGYVNAARAMARLRDEPLNPELANVRCRVDVVGADGDTFCPKRAADILLDTLPDARYHEIAGAGHLMNVDQPGLVTELLRTLLDGGGKR